MPDISTSYYNIAFKNKYYYFDYFVLVNPTNSNIFLLQKNMKSTFKLICIFLFLALNPGILFSQKADTVSFRDILDIALRNNYQLIISQNEAEIASNNNTAGNAGFLPTFDVSAGNNTSIVDSKQEFYDGRVKDVMGAQNNAFSALAEINWTVFDGLKMWATKDRLTELENQGILRVQLEIEKTYLDLATLYYELVQQQKLLQVLKNSMDVSRARLALAEKKFSIGASSEVDLNQAKIDMSEDSTRLVKQQVMMKNLLADINIVAARPPEIIFVAANDINLETMLEYSSLLASMQNQNSSLLIARSQARIKQLEIKENQANLMPHLSLFADYSYAKSHSETGLLQSNTTSGPAFGVTFSYNLFNGLNDKRQIKNSKINYETAIVHSKQILNSLNAELYKAFNNYTGALQEVILERSNLENAGKNLKIAIELYRAGAINEIEFRDIQQKALEAENRLLTAEYLAKIAELNLRQISGKLEI